MAKQNIVTGVFNSTTTLCITVRFIFCFTPFMACNEQGANTHFKGIIMLHLQRA